MIEKLIVFFLLVSAVNLTLMIPGGAIESRDFTHIPPAILGGFNIFLTILGMLSLFIAYFVFKKQKWAYLFAIACGLSYFIVYTIDLAKLFPQSPTAMPLLLFVLEVLGIILAIPLMYYSFRRYTKHENTFSSLLNNRILYFFMGAAIIIGLGIIIFATKAAMTGN